ncbi:MAG: glycosyltransferase [Anaerolineales bacterium]|nr:glycosyltransferase [Anaerolineales bacterium]
MSALIISSVCFLAGLAIITWMHNQYELDIVVRPSPLPDVAPLISVCVPARNEERNIRRCVEALLAQTYPNYEIIVLDDRSTDATAEILVSIRRSVATRPSGNQNDRLKIINGSDLPPGWAGKPHALTQAAAAAHGEWLCFVDADTFVTPDALAAVYVKAAGTKADLFTIMTRQIMLTFWERTILPLVMLALSVGFSPRRVNDPKRKDAIANGQFIFIKRNVYEAVGGHVAIKGSIVEDKDLAVLVKGKGYRLVVADGRQVASTRMYTSLSEMWEGWTKNIYLGLRDDRGLLWLGVFGAFLAFTAALLLPAWVIWGVILAAAGSGLEGSVVLLEAVLLWGYLIFWRVRASRGMDIPTWYALTTPIGAGVFAAMMITSAWNVLSGKGVTWKGRMYSPGK